MKPSRKFFCALVVSDFRRTRYTEKLRWEKKVAEMKNTRGVGVGKEKIQMGEEVEGII